MLLPSSAACFPCLWARDMAAACDATRVLKKQLSPLPRATATQRPAPPVRPDRQQHRLHPRVSQHHNIFILSFSLLPTPRSPYNTIQRIALLIMSSCAPSHKVLPSWCRRFESGPVCSDSCVPRGTKRASEEGRNRARQRPVRREAAPRPTFRSGLMKRS